MRQRDFLFAAIRLAVVIGMFVGRGLDAAAQCQPDTTHAHQVAGLFASSDVKNAVSIDGAGAAYPDFGVTLHQAGFYRRCRADYVEAHIDAFAWAKNGHSSSIQFEARATRLWSFTTTCIPLSASTDVAPFGDGYHQIESNYSMAYSVSGAAGTGSRAVSISMLVEALTGRQIGVTYNLSDHATNDETNVVVATGSARLDFEGSRSIKLPPSAGGAGQVIQGGVNETNNIGLSGSFGVYRANSRSSNQAVNFSDAINLTDRSVIATMCHHLSRTGREVVEIRGSIDVTASTNGSQIIQATADADVVVSSIVQSYPYRQCKTLAPVSGAPLPLAPPQGGGTTHPAPTPGGATPGGSGNPGGNGAGSGTGNPTTPGQPGGTRPEPKSHVVPVPTKGTAGPMLGAPVGKGKATFYADIAQLRAGVAPAALHVRLAPSSVGKIAWDGQARAECLTIKPESHPSFDFDPTQPLALLLPGIWWITIPITATTAGVHEVEMSYDANFPPDNSAIAKIECIAAPFTVAPWKVGTHSMPVAQRDPLTLSPEQTSFRLERLTTESWSMIGSPTVSFAATTVPKGFAWNWAPTCDYDAAADTYIIRMAPNQPVSGELTITRGSHQIVVPTRFNAGLPEYR